MPMVRRHLQTVLETKLYDGKAIILTGARQVGKTTLLQTLFGSSDDTIWLNGDEPDVRALLH